MLKKKALRKEFFMEIRKSMGRFISIFFIVALGVAFYAGIRSSEPSMRISGDAYFDREMLMDIKIMGTMGLTENDIEAIEAVEGIAFAEGAYSKDVLCTVNETEKVIHLLSAQEKMNAVEVTQGRLPEKEGECLVDEDFFKLHGFQLGDVITFRSGNEEELSDSLVTDTYEIVGAGNSPLYISFGRGNSLIGNGEASGFMVLAPESFAYDIYTEIYVCLENASEALVFTDAYDELSENALDILEQIEEERSLARKQEVIGSALEEVEEAEAQIEEESQKLADAKEELEEGKKTAKKELTAAKKELDKAEQTIAASKAQLAAAKKQIEAGKAELAAKEAELAAAKQQYESGMAELPAKKAELQSAEETYNQSYKTMMPLIQAGKKPLEAGIAEFDRQISILNGKLEGAAEEEKKLIELSIQGIEKQKSIMESKLSELQAQENQLIEAGQQIEAGKAQIAQAESQLAAAKGQIESGEAQIAAAWAELEANEKQIVAGEKELQAGERELSSGKSKYQSARSEAEAELANAEIQIADGEKELNDAKAEIAEARAEIELIEDPEWYIQNRSDAMQDYDGYGENADRMGSLGKVFPVLFFMVAALISLTTMTRMVEEQRTQIGTLKALGYDKFDIAKKYIYYALFATVGGSILGALVGEKIIPFVIIYAYKIMYVHIPDIVLPYHWEYAIQAALISICCTLAATMIACYKELAAQPAQLMRPPAPKNGKRIFLEKIPWLWGKLSFTWKSSVRNMVRYKKRFFMTILGIGGCMALMVVGFGLKDCIYEIVTLQYDEIQFYDASVYMEDAMTEEEKEDIMMYLETNAAVKACEQIQMQSFEVTSEHGKESVFLTVPADEKGIEKLFAFRSRTKEEIYHLDSEEVILTEKAATLLQVEPGDTIKVLNEEKGDKEFTLAAICENYMGNYLYISNAEYEKAYGKTSDYNSILYSVEDDKEEMIEELGKELLARDHVVNVSYTNSIEGRLDDMLGSLNLVIVVLIISAGLLAFVVLYNLNNINITERRRELATLKVLGFFDGEVATYVFRENILLTFISAIVGVILGDFLHGFTILTVEVENVMFGRDIHMESYVYSFLLTLLFSLIINGLMYFKLKKIDMVESLKSVE